MKRLLFILGSIFLLFHFLFLWIHTNIDGYFYWAIGQFFKTGIYPFVSPFIYAKPTTISPPLYGIFLALLESLPFGDMLLHLIQLLLLATTTLLLYKILKTIVSSNTAALVSFLFLIFPTNVIYAGSMMTEIASQTALTVYLYLIHKKHLGNALILSSVMILLKYQFLFLFLFTAIMCIREFRKYIIYALLGFFIITLWAITNHTITGVWGLSDTKKMPFYTNMVWSGRYFPPNSDPSVIALRAYVPATSNQYAEYWDLQDFILPKVNRQWTMVDELLGNVGIAAIRTHPKEYVTNGVRIFFQTITHRAPWFDNLETFGGYDPGQPLYCDRLGSIQFCKPIIMTSISYPLWNAYVKLSRAFYNLVVPPFLLFFFLPMLAISLLDTRIRLFALIYLSNLIPISYLSMVESRYLIPYYPLIVIIIVLGIQTLHLSYRSLTRTMSSESRESRT